MLVPLTETYSELVSSNGPAGFSPQMLETVCQTGHRLHEAELYRLKGELWLKTSRVELEAETCFIRAFEIARAQSAKWWELRATTSLARLLTMPGRGHKARGMLAEIYRTLDYANILTTC